MSAEGPTAKLDPSYRPAQCCQTCQHCVLIWQQYYTDSFCNLNGDMPPEFKIQEWFDRIDKATTADLEVLGKQQDAAYWARVEWERDHDVDQWGYCDRYTPVPAASS